MITVAYPDETWPAEVGDVEGVRPIVWRGGQPLPQEHVDVVVTPYMAARRTVEESAGIEGLRLLQLLSAGYDDVADIVPPGVPMANARGVHDTATAELALGLTIASQRAIDVAVRDQAKGEWPPREETPGLADRRVTLVGYGSVGRAIAVRMLACEAELTVVASRPRDGDDLVDRVLGIDDLPGLLPATEVLVLVTPLSEQTRGLAGEEVLGALPDGALVVNVARGPVLDTDAALRHAGRLRFALDVTDPEPLPPDHPLWTAPGVLVTPHRGGASGAFRPRAAALLREQLGRVVRGEPPLHVVTP